MTAIEFLVILFLVCATCINTLVILHDIEKLKDQLRQIEAKS